MSLPSASTVPAALAAAQRHDPARPLVTFYDDATGERVELSVVTTANWVAKTASLLVEELDVERGDVVVLDLPCHWLTPVWLLACWSVGAVVAEAGADGPAVVVSGPDRLDDHASAADSRTQVVGLSLRPLGGPFATPLPPGVIDFAVTVPGQPDEFVPFDPPAADDPALHRAPAPLTQADLLARADATGERVLTDLSPGSDRGISLLLGGLVHGGSAIWVRRPAEDGWASRAEQERAARLERA